MSPAPVIARLFACFVVATIAHSLLTGPGLLLLVKVAKVAAFAGLGGAAIVAVACGVVQVINARAFL